MGEVFGYLASAEGTSVLVAVIALFGVLASTGWTNWEADKRRREDQRDENLRRQRERDDVLTRAELVRQREAVSKCVNRVRAAYAEEFQKQEELVHQFGEGAYKGDEIQEGNLAFSRFIAQSNRYLSAINAVEELRLEVTQPSVRRKTLQLSEQLHREGNVLHEAIDAGSWLEGSTLNSLTPEVANALDQLVDAAFQHLHVQQGG